MIKVRKDLTGSRFGRLLILKQVEDYISPKGQHKTKWLCQCDCGKQCEVLGNNLQKGTSKSCGCYANELLKQKSYHNQISKRYNRYDLSGDYGVGYTSKGKPFYFDLEDYDKIKDYCWYDDGKGYLRSRVILENTKIMMHHIIIEVPKGYCVDHINHDTYDNRKSNLRIVTTSQNAMNRRLSINNTSGCKGVRCVNGKYKSVITHNNKVYSLGTYKFYDEAVEKRKKAEEYFLVNIIITQR